jgi:hypothetical protein
MSDRSVYENEVFSQILAPFRPKPGISDADRAGEYHAMKLVAEAYPSFVRAVQIAIEHTDLRKDALTDALAGLADAMPDLIAWTEKISDARRGY